MADQIAYVGDTSGDEVLDVTFYVSEVDGVVKDFINIKIPGDKTVEVNVVADETYQRRFARRWEAYKSMQAIDCGTPIDEWDDVPRGLKDELKHQGFRFIEQVAGAGENAFTRIMGGIQWRTKAQAFLNRGKKSSDDIIKQQQEQIDLMQKQMAALLEAVQNNNLGEVKRGRKPKESTQTETEKVESGE